MPTGIINLAKNMPSMIGRNSSNNIVGSFESSSSSILTLDIFQEPNMEGGHQLHALDMPQNTSESDIPRIREDKLNSATKPGSENHEGASEEDQDPRPNKKRYHRHTQHQIQEMEAFFKECPHPDDKKRKELSRELRLEPLQVKFWFQNKRTQMKAQQERVENSKLRDENDKLRADNMMYREALIKASCPDCGGPTAKGAVSFHEHHLRLENARLKEEIDRISGMAANAKHQGKQPVVDYSDISPPLTLRPLELDVGGVGSSLGGPPAAGGGGSGSSGGPAVVGGGGGDLLRSINGPTEANKPMIIELAVAAMEELIGMAQMGEPLWLMATIDGPTTLLDEDEYIRTFPRGIGPKPAGFRRETSRETAVVAMNHVNLVGILMDANRWSTLFSGIVSRAMTLEVLSTGVVAGNYNGALQVMAAELQVPSPLVPTRESYFVRYCKKHADGTWAVVDVSLDNLLPGPSPRYRRRPSGCLIQEMPNGHSKVTWVEHAEVDGRGVHNLFKHLVSSGHAFGANRWVATLDRQCERLASAMASNVPTADVSVITSQGGRKSIMKLAERMVASFCGGVSASTAQWWTTVTGAGADDVRVMTRKSVDDPGRPRGIVLNAATSFWLPAPPRRVFDFLRAENSRSEWDILSNGGVVQEIAHIANGQDSGNRLSLLRVNNSNNSSQSNMLVLQESCTDSSVSFVIYAPVDIAAINVVLNGGDPDLVALLPSGFAILPDGTTGHASGIAETNCPGGSLLTVAFQILVDSSPTAKLSLGSVSTVNHLIELTVERIKASLSSEAAA